MHHYLAETYTFHYNFDSSTTSAGLYLLTVVILILVWRYGLRYLWFRKRLHALKDRHTVIAQYSAPPDIPPAFFGAIIDNRVSLQDLAATILWLHQQQYLRIEYRPDKQDFRIQVTNPDASKLIYKHQVYAQHLVTSQPEVWASQLKESSVNNIQEFNFALLQDLQQAGYYQFHPRMATLTATQYYTGVIARAVGRGLIKPWNWPGFLLMLIFPWYGPIWLILSVVYYNRIGFYNYRTPQWEARWPELSGYYNYLRLAEAERRSFELTNPTTYQVANHDPYLVSALLQPQWQHYFTGSSEIGAGGDEYKTA